jgi:hypothetical protein
MGSFDTERRYRPRRGTALQKNTGHFARKVFKSLAPKSQEVKSLSNISYTNEKRERKSLQAGQTTLYLEMLRGAVPSARIEVIGKTGHFPQLEEPARTNALLDSFLASVFA